MSSTQQQSHITLEMLGLSASVNPMTALETVDWFEYPGYFRSTSHCQIDVFGREGGSYFVVVATELAKNDGLSITNGAEYLASRLCKHLNCKPEQLVLVEHYRADNILAEHWDLTRFKKIYHSREGWKFEEPEWFPMQKTELERLVGLEIPSGW